MTTDLDGMLELYAPRKSSGDRELDVSLGKSLLNTSLIIPIIAVGILAANQPLQYFVEKVYELLIP